MIEKLKKKYKGLKTFVYSEYKTEEGLGYGWVAADLISGPVVIAYPSQSKKVSALQREVAKNMGTTAASVEDYKLIFKRMTSETPVDFMSKWGERPEQFSVFWKSSGEFLEPDFIFSLAVLLTEGKKFSSGGRLYKIVSEGDL